MGIANGILLTRNITGNLQKLFFNINRTIGGVNFDAIISYDYKTAVRLTENPVEDGFNVNDHRIITPNVIMIECGVSNTITPQTLMNGRPDLNTIINFGEQLVFGGRDPFGGAKSRIAATYQAIQDALLNGEPFDIETPLATFKNMLIVDVNPMQDSESINLFKGTITLQELITYQTQQLNDTTQKAGVVPSTNGGQKRPAPSDIITQTQAGGII